MISLHFLLWWKVAEALLADTCFVSRPSRCRVYVRGSYLSPGLASPARGAAGLGQRSGCDAFFFVFLKIDLMPHDLITQLLRVLAIETKQEKAMVHADPTELTLSGLEAFSFDYVVKWPLSLIINR